MGCGNKIWRITLDTNPEDCNYHCIMCEEHSEFSRFKDDLFMRTGCRHRRMPVEWIPKIIEEAAGIGVSEIIPSTMGEPLLYAGIDELLKCAADNDLKINLTTNGSFPGRPVDEWARRIIPIASDVKVSINGATQATSEAIMRGSDFARQLHNIGEFVRIRNDVFRECGRYCSLTLQMTFMQSNVDELADIVRLACELGMDRVKGHHLWTHFREIEHLSMKDSPARIEKWNRCVNDAFAALGKHARMLPSGKMLRLENIVPLENKCGKEVPSDFECPFLDRELWISATGEISPCCCPDEKRRTLGSFGSFPKTSLSNVIGSKEYRELCNDYKSRDVCQTCNMRRPAQ